MIAEGTAIMLVGILIALTLVTFKVRSPVALMGFAFSVLFLGMFQAGLVTEIFVYGVFAMHAIAIAMTAAFRGGF